VNGEIKTQDNKEAESSETTAVPKKQFMSRPKKHSLSFRQQKPSIEDELQKTTESTNQSFQQQQQIPEEQQQQQTNYNYGEPSDLPPEAFYAQYYPQYAHHQIHDLPKASNGAVPRQFKELEIGGTNIVDIKFDDLRADRPQQALIREPEYHGYDDLNPKGVGEIELDGEDQSNEVWNPGKSHRRQHQISYLLWEAREKASELEARRLESSRTKKESRSKYGW